MLFRPTNFLLLLIAASSTSFVSRQPQQLAAPAQILQTQSVIVQNPSVYPLEGTVINAVTGQPVGNALVQIYIMAGRHSVLSGAEGKFHFDAVPEGKLGMNVQKPGFFSERQIAAGFPDSVEVGPGMAPVVLKLVPEGVIYGRITDAAGDPVENLQVKALSGQVIDGRRDWQQQFGVQTNGDGEFRMFELRPSTYFVSAGTFTSTFYPGVRDVGSATAIAISPGQQVQADFQLQPAVFYQISGTIVGLPPGTSANVEMISMNFGGPRANFPLNRQGNFTRAVAAGQYLLHATANTPGGQLTASIPLNVASNMTGVRLVLVPTATIPVHVNFELTRNTSPQPPGGQPGVTVRLIPSDNTFSNRSYFANMRPDLPPEQRIFAVRGVDPCVCRVEIMSTGPWYVAAAQRGATDLLAQELVVDSGGEGEPIEITVRDDFPTLLGSVTSDGQPAPGGVLLIPQREQQRGLTIPVDASGHFRSDTVWPGEYTVYAFDRTTNLEYRNADVMRQYANDGQTVRLQPGSEASVNLQLQKRAEF
jgi:Carboxypeptidase regulatory-like domain